MLRLEGKLQLAMLGKTGLVLVHASCDRSPGSALPGDCGRYSAILWPSAVLTKGLM